MPEEILSLKGISKSFAGVKALESVDFSCVEGEVHCIAGENGAGKSTLLKIISGLHEPDCGTFTLFGKNTCFKDPDDAQQHGIAMVYQELTLIPEMTVAENVFLSIEPVNAFGLIDKKNLMLRLSELMDSYSIAINPQAIVKNLPIAHQQLTEILKILMRDPKIIILDEPTSALARREVDTLFSIVRAMLKKNKTIIFISHRAEEIFEISNRITVLKDGELIGTENTDAIDNDRLVQMMIGRSLTNVFPKSNSIDKENKIFEVNNLNVENKVNNASFSLFKGEVVGIAGLSGHGQSELLNGIAGIASKNSGDVFLRNKKINIDTPWNALEEGIALVPIDRKTEGLFLSLSVRQNLALTTLQKRSKCGFIKKRDEDFFIEKMTNKLSIKVSNSEVEVRTLSGGNQQKVVLGRQLATEPKVLLFDEPTRGIDIQSKSDFYYLMRELADEGIGIIISSSELVEIVGMCDRVIVMYEGKITGILTGSEISEENIMRCAVGLEKAVSNDG